MISLPLGPESIRLTWVRNRRPTRSPFTARAQTQIAENEWWEGALVLPPLTDAEAAEWRAWLLKLKGRSGTFEIPRYKGNRGSESGTPEVAGDDQRGRSLQTTGWNSSAAGVFVAGDYFGLDGHLYMVTSDVDADSSGNATIRIWPRLREPPLSGTLLTLENPTMPARLTRDVNPYEIQPALFHRITLEFRESL